MRRLRTLTVLLGILLGALLLGGPIRSAPAAAPMTLPSGFVDELVVGGLLAPRAFTFAPDGRLFILERGSAASDDQNLASVRVFKDGQLLATRALSLTTCGDSERGLLGLALDPDFANNGYLYLYYTRPALSGSACGYNYHPDPTGTVGPRNRVSRFTLTGDVIDPASERVLIDGIITNVGYHNAGDLHFGQDGYLYVSTGDGGVSSLAATNDNLNGKILRLLPTPGPAGGYTTAGNPFDGAVGARFCGTAAQTYGNGPCREVYAYGLRNPFRFSVKPGTSTLYVGDVGGGAWEEIDEIASGGGNYGWPTREGFCPSGVLNNCSATPPGLTDPIYAYPHAVLYANEDSAVIGGAFYTGTITGTTYPAEYLNNYFFADVVRGFVRRLAYNGASSTWVAVDPDFGTEGWGIIGLQPGLDGNLHYLSFVTDQGRVNELRRIRYAPGGNQTPYAQAGVDPTGGPLDTVYTFSAAGSGDPDGTLPLTYAWDFGDGLTTTTTALTTTHTYSLAGTTVVTLTVADNGAPPLTSTPITLTVFPGNDPPTATLQLANLTAPGRDHYYVRDAWQFAAADASPDAASFAWSVVFHHDNHTHPFLPSPPAGVYTFTTTFNESDPDVWYRVHLRVTDPEGQTAEFHQDVLPQHADLTFQPDPAGAQFVVDGLPYTAPVTVTRVVGVEVPVSAPSPQTLGGWQYAFRGWSDGGSAGHTITTPAGGGSYTALFWTNVFLPLARR